MKWYELVFKQKQPLHIGSVSWGVVKQTYIFIPGWTMWGALTKAYNMHNNKPLSENQELFKTITCFYPCFDEKGTHPLFPAYKDGTFHLEKYPEDKFRYEFTDTFVSTAILPESRSAKNESLHEMEILLPKSKSEKKQLYWVGLLGIEDCEKEIDNFLRKKSKLKIYIGGDIRYGIGELELVNHNNGRDEELKKWQISDGALFDNSSLNNELKNFLEFSSGLNFQGELILHAEFDFLKNEPRVKEAKYLITPGSKILQELNNYKLKKGIFITYKGV